MSSIKLTHLHNPSIDDLGRNCFNFLSHLGGPSVIHIDGKDNSRCRVVVTLLHGNEPSGLKAIHTLIQQDFLPITSLKIIIASVVAARTEPAFSNRMLPGQRDLNRCFSDSVFDIFSLSFNNICLCVTSLLILMSLVLQQHELGHEPE